jgi:chromate transport protein ChrA
VCLEASLSLPGAIAAYALAVGVNRISDTLPSVVYALLSGLNAATVGIIALAAVQLSQKAATDKITRILVFLGGSAGLLYNTLWYFPVLMVLGAVTTVVWDYRWCHNAIDAARARMKRSRSRLNTSTEEGQPEEPTMLQDVIRPEGLSDAVSSSVQTGATASRRHPSPEETEEQVVATPESNVLSWKFGVTVISCFFLTFTAIMIVRGSVQDQPFGFRVFANLYLAGTIIFGGGPVVIPLLREYVVAEGWVSPRNFLLGLAICQAYPGPNFNFAVYLGALAVAGHLNAAAGAIIGYIAIFGPGIILHTGTMSLWKILRNIRWFVSALRGINATAVGLIYTAVYRLWEQGLLSETFASGSSLGLDPWWLVVTATSFVGGHWFNVPAPATIVLGGIMGIVWYGVTKT